MHVCFVFVGLVGCMCTSVCVWCVCACGVCMCGVCCVCVCVICVCGG